MILQKGYFGDEVSKTRKQLIELGYLQNESDIFDDDMDMAVRQFQEDNQLIINGQIDKTTANFLYKKVAQLSNQDSTDTEPIIPVEKEQKQPQNSPKNAPENLFNQLSSEGIQLILDYEVGGGKGYYDRFLKHPTVPGGSSGITIGIGIDLGYTDKSTFDIEWAELDGSLRKRLYPAIGLTCGKAKAFLSSIKDIEIPWEMAYNVFTKHTLQKWIKTTAKVYPDLDKLNGKAQLALTSLVFNRGPSLEGPRRAEMLAIRELVKNQDYRGIANQIRKMKRLWIGTDIEKGMTNRRNAEAALIESCI